MSRTFVIGDIHGCSNALVRLLAQIDPDPARDTMVFLGDYIDRGPDAKGVVEEILRLRMEFGSLITLMGNHEQMLLAFLEGWDRMLYLANGGNHTLASYGISRARPGAELSDSIPSEHMRFFLKLPLYWEDEENIYVHAGLQPGVPLNRQSTEWLLWSRDMFINSRYDFGKRVIFGHTHFDAPLVEPNKIGIDTGAVFGGRLTCLILPDLEFVSVPGLM